MAYDKSLTAEHISSNLQNYEAARSGFFTLIVDGLDNILKSTYIGNEADAQDTDRIANAQEILKLNVTASSVPQFTINVQRYERGNETVKFAGKPQWNNTSITVDDVVGLNTKEILLSWKALAYNTHTRKGGRMSSYKKTCTLVEYTQDYEPIRSWTLYGCFVTAVNDSEFNKASDDKRSLTATIEYDRAEESYDIVG